MKIKYLRKVMRMTRMRDEIKNENNNVVHLRKDRRRFGHLVNMRNNKRGMIDESKSQRKTNRNMGQFDYRNTVNKMSNLEKHKSFS